MNAISQLLDSKLVNETYNIGSNNEISNIELVNKILTMMNKDFGFSSSIFNLVEFVEDRFGHDQRYAINSRKINLDLGWESSLDSDEALKETIEWYIKNEPWWSSFQKKA